jgi:hypothetical protein
LEDSIKKGPVRSQVRVAVERFLEIVEKNAVLMELRPDGTYEPVKPDAASEPESQ